MSHPVVAELLQHTRALRALARDLVGDAAADDVLQETAIQAMTAAPSQPGPFGGWLRSVVQHLASKHRRAERVRRLHELAAARGEAQPADRSAESSDTLRRLTEIVTTLPEPYRGTVLARYLRGRSPREIAIESSTPVRTVKTRLQRSLALLRERFAERDANWRSLLAATFGIDHALTATSFTSAILLMNATTKAALAGTALLLAGLLTWYLATPAAPPTDPVTSTPAAPVVASVRDVATANDRKVVETPAAPGTSTPPQPATPADPAIVDPVVVLALDAATGAPVERFALRAPLAPPQSMLDLTIPLLHAGLHPGGRLVLPAAALEQQTFHLEDSERHFVPSRWFTLDDAVVRGGERVIEVRLLAPLAVELTVLRENSRAPVEGSKVEVLRPWVASPVVTLSTTAQPVDRFRAQPGETPQIVQFTGGRALLLSAGTTDRDGRVALQVPPGEAVSLRLLGPGHRPAVRSDYVVARSPPPVQKVELVSSGGAIRGRVLPPEALARLRPDLPAPPKGLNPGVLQNTLTGLHMWHRQTHEVIPPQRLLRLLAPLAEDGTFAIDGLTPGDWKLMLCYPLRVQESDRGPWPKDDPQHVFHGFTRMQIDVRDIDDLHDEELRVIDIDVSALVPGSLEATLTPPDLGPSGCILVTAILGTGAPFISAPNLRCDRDGRFLATLAPARYRASWHGPRGQPDSFPLADFEIHAGTLTRVDFVIETRAARFRVLEADGTTPASGLLELRREGRTEPWSAMHMTDASGLTGSVELPRGALHGWFMRSLLEGTDPAQVRYRNAAHGSGLFGDAIDLGVVLAADNTGELQVLTLPRR